MLLQLPSSHVGSANPGPIASLPRYGLSELGLPYPSQLWNSTCLLSSNQTWVVMSMGPGWERRRTDSRFLVKARLAASNTECSTIAKSSHTL